MKKGIENIIEAAIRVFMRYGIRRTTMNDIALEAGLVRQTLYTVYANKDAVLCAAIRYHSERSLAAIIQDWQSAENLGEKLDLFFEHSVIASYAVINSSPDARDMIGGFNEAGKAEIQRAKKQKITAISGILVPFEAVITRAGLSVEQLADYIQNASLGVRDAAQSKRHLNSMLGALRTTVLALANEI